jgi:hypothetical protein
MHIPSHGATRLSNMETKNDDNTMKQQINQRQAIREIMHDE